MQINAISSSKHTHYKNSQKPTKKAALDDKK